MSRRISDLINAPVKLRIKDYAKIEAIFILYLRDHYDTMAREIYWYRVSDFLVDIQLYLTEHFRNGSIREFYLQDIKDEYFAREESVWYENELKKARKKYRL